MPEQNHNLYAQFRQSFAGCMDKNLLVTDSGRAYTYDDIDRESGRIANALALSGAKPGDRVSVQVKKSPEALCLYLACLRGGFVFHPLNTGYRTDELAYFLGNAEPTVIVTDSDGLDTIEPIAKNVDARYVLTLNEDNSGTLLERARCADSYHVVALRGRHDAACLLYSSGTTGEPKGIVLTHANLYENARTLTQVWGFTEKDILLHALPIFHVHGLFVALGCVFLSGASMRWLPGFDANQVVDFLPACTTMMGVPTYYVRLLNSKAFTRETVENIRLFVSGSAPLLKETFSEFQERTGHRILERYGMTETNMNTSNPLVGERRPGTVGLPLPGVDVRITNDAGSVLPRNEIGNLQVHGANVFREYWKMPEKTATDFTADGFFKTGDIGVIDDEGYVAIVGRSKDMIISGGLNIYPVEIESVINDMKGIKESAVIGIPHSDFGEGVVAVVVLSNDTVLSEDQVIASAKDKLAQFKVPKRILFADELPRNTMGKVQKNRLRDDYETLFSRASR